MIFRYERKTSDNPLAFKFYNPDRAIGGKTMEKHLRFAVCYWHTFCGKGGDPFGPGTQVFAWDEPADPMDAARARLDAAFELFSKLGVPYYCFHDRDIAPEGAGVAESERNLQAMTELAAERQRETGVKLLWGTANLFSHPRYMNGAATNPDFNVVARDYGRGIGFKGTFLIEPKPMEPSKHQYDFDAQTVICFIRHHGLENDFKVNVEANHATLAGHSFAHELRMCADAGLLGSIDANRGDPQNGWDTDQFPVDLYDSVSAMLVVLENGGPHSGGLNFDAKVRRESVDPEDIFIGHIGGIDTFARSLEIAHNLIERSPLIANRDSRYAGFDDGDGAAFERGELGLQALRDIAAANGEPASISGRQEWLENLVNQYI